MWQLFFLQVLGATFDGASVNCRLVKDAWHHCWLHPQSAKRLCRWWQMAIFLLRPTSPHKDNTNCWASKCRSLWVSVYVQAHLWSMLILSVFKWKQHFLESSREPVWAWQRESDRPCFGSKAQIWAHPPVIFFKDTCWPRCPDVWLWYCILCVHWC